MGANDHIKKMNMKVSNALKPKSAYAKQNSPKNSPAKSNAGSVSDCQSSNTNSEVWDPKLFEGLSRDQKKKLRKKLQRKRRQEKKSSS